MTIAENATQEAAEVNLYSPEMRHAEEKIRAQIKSDLEHLGEVKVIKGVITPTPNHGTLLDGVVAEVRNPKLTQPLKISVLKGDDGNPIYFNEGRGGGQVTPRRSYATEMSDHQQAVVGNAFFYWSSHPAVEALREDPNVGCKTEPSGIGAEHILFYGSLLLLFLVTALGAFMEISASMGFWHTEPNSAFGEFVTVAIVGSAVLLVAAAIGAELHRRFSRKARNWRMHQEGVSLKQESIKTWESGRAEMFHEAFPSPVERSVFLDYLLTACRGVGLENPTGFHMTAAWADAVTSSPCVVFQAGRSDEEEQFLFDGVSVFKVSINKNLDWERQRTVLAL